MNNNLFILLILFIIWKVFLKPTKSSFKCKKIDATTTTKTKSKISVFGGFLRDVVHPLYQSYNNINKKDCSRDVITNSTCSFGCKVNPKKDPPCISESYIEQCDHTIFMINTEEQRGILDFKVITIKDLDWIWIDFGNQNNLNDKGKELYKKIYTNYEEVNTKDFESNKDKCPEPNNKNSYYTLETKYFFLNDKCRRVNNSVLERGDNTIYNKESNNINLLIQKNDKLLIDGTDMHHSYSVKKIVENNNITTYEELYTMLKTLITDTTQKTINDKWWSDNKDKLQKLMFVWKSIRGVFVQLDRVYTGDSSFTNIQISPKTTVSSTSIPTTSTTVSSTSIPTTSTIKSKNIMDYKYKGFYDKSIKLFYPISDKNMSLKQYLEKINSTDTGEYPKDKYINETTFGIGTNNLNNPCETVKTYCNKSKIEDLKDIYNNPSKMGFFLNYCPQTCKPLCVGYNKYINNRCDVITDQINCTSDKGCNWDETSS